MFVFVRKECKFSHDIQSQHNHPLLRECTLHQLNEDDLFLLLLQNDPALLPEVRKCKQEGWNSHLNVSHERIPPRRLNHAMTGIFLHSRYLSCRLKRPPSFLSLRSQLWEVFRVEQSSCNRSDVCSGMLESVTGYTQIYNEVIEYLSM